MNSTAVIYLSLQKIGIGFQTLKKLTSRLGGIQHVLGATYESLLDAEASPEFVRRYLAALHAFDPDDYAQSVQTSGTTIVCLEDPHYPPLLREIHSPPLVLFVRGNINALHGTCCAVVGTRAATPYGRSAVRSIVEPLAASGITIVSGLAYGIDAEVHRAALEVKGKTFAVLGNGIDRIYPYGNADLAMDILRSDGAIISEYPPNTGVQKHFFPQRNRIISGMSQATLIIEADVRSGALITARTALDENREVFAVPGPIDAPKSSGPNNLIKMGASVATSADDLRTVLGLDRVRQVRDNSEIRGDSASETTLLTLLDAPRHIDELVAMSTLDTSVVNATLSLLEMKGRIRHLGGLHYTRVN